MQDRKMGRWAVRIGLLTALWLPGTLAQAGPYSDDLSKCLVQSASADDQTTFLTFVFAAMSEHPAIGGYSNISPAQHVAISKAAAALTQRLLTVDCRAQSVKALRFEGTSAFQSAFRTLGETAMRGLMTNEAVAGQLNGLAQYFDRSKLEALGKDAAQADASAPTAN